VGDTMIVAVLKGKKLNAKEKAAVSKRIKQVLGGKSEVSGQGETCIGGSVGPVTVTYCK